MKKNKLILGLDLGSNSIGWALLDSKDNMPTKIEDLGIRIFNKAVEEKTPTPKNQKRREMRLGRRVIQRRAGRKQRMLNYLVSLDLLPQELQKSLQPEVILNSLGNPYELRTKALDNKLSPHEFGRVLLHFVARRGFLSTKKQIAGDLMDDPDTIEYLEAIDKTDSKDSDETAFKADIEKVRKDMDENNARTLGEYLRNLEQGKCTRNRQHAGGHLRTDRAMYKDELAKIWQQQEQYFNLSANFIEQIEKIIFYQRPLKLKKDRIGKCSLEPKNYRANIARLEAQKSRYLQTINNIKYLAQEEYVKLTDEQKQILKNLFEQNRKVTVPKIKKTLGFGQKTNFDVEESAFKGNTTACDIREVIGDVWDKLEDVAWEKYKNGTSKTRQHELFEDLFTIKKKSVLKERLINYWGFDSETAIKLCLLDFEPGHTNLSLKAIDKLLPFLEQGLIYSDARMKAGYDYKQEETSRLDKLPAPPETANPIVNKGMHELRRVVNAIIKQYGKPRAIRIEMARDLEMNTERYNKMIALQKENRKANEAAVEIYRQEKKAGTSQYPSYDEKIKYRLWLDQDKRCIYSGKTIALAQLFSDATEIDHILPYKKSLDDSYMNKVICFTGENREKSDRTPIDAWGSNPKKWNQVTQALARWDQKSLKSKIGRFYRKEAETNWDDKDFVSSQLNDTRYISKLALEYVKKLGCEVSVTKGGVVSEIRHQWGFNDVINETNKKDRTDHRHHAIDAVVIAATSRDMYKKAVAQMKYNKLKIAAPYPEIRDELKNKLNNIIISHVAQRKLAGALHEETGASYIPKHGGLVYRKNINPEFTVKNAGSIVDPAVKDIVLDHIKKSSTIKEAFNDTIYHKDGKTPIKRVRVLQSKTNEKKLMQYKFAVKDKSGKVFKYMSYGNIHHVEIVRDKKTGAIEGEFVPMMLASHRAKGINMPKQAIVNTNHGTDKEFIMALHINDMVSIKNPDGKRVYYRMQKLEADSNRVMLRLHTAAKVDVKEEEIRIGINKNNFDEYDIQLHKVNAIGQLS